MVLGVIYLYRCNRGAEGQKFLQRTVSIYWVGFVRFFILVMLPATLLYVATYDLVLELAHGDTLSEVVFSSLMALLFYLYLGRHVKDVASNVTPKTSTVSGPRPSATAY